jgi:hypothetical protein
VSKRRGITNDEELLGRAKVQPREEGISLSRLVERALAAVACGRGGGFSAR